MFDSAGRVLLVKHSYGRMNWELPGGNGLPAEDPQSTARRELREETGLDLPIGPLTGMYYEPGHALGAFLHAVFRAEWAGSLPDHESPEVSAVRFWPLDSLPRPLSDFTARRISDAVVAPAGFAVILRREWL